MLDAHSKAAQQVQEAQVEKETKKREEKMITAAVVPQSIATDNEEEEDNDEEMDVAREVDEANAMMGHAANVAKELDARTKKARNAVAAGDVANGVITKDR